MSWKKELYPIFNERIRKWMREQKIDLNDWQEIRIKANECLLLRNCGREKWMQKKLTYQEVWQMFQQMCQYSPYAYEAQMKQGFITLIGGHRVGIAGEVVMEPASIGGTGRREEERSGIRAFRSVSALNIRIAKEIKGCANELVSYILNGEKIYSTLIISPPGRGKTTMLRDAIRILSGTTEEKGFCVGVVDQRLELAAAYQGVPTLDLGCRTNVMSLCEKSDGVELLVRSMAPEIIAVDELGTGLDLLGCKRAKESGVSVIATLHGKELEDISRIREEGIFERYIFLSDKLSEIERVYDEKEKEWIHRA